MNFTHLNIATTTHTATVTLNRPGVRNAFNEILIRELTEVFLELGQRPDLRAIVLAGNGPTFCAGADLNWMRRMADYTDDENRADALTLAQMLHTVWSCPKPVIARVHGDTYAGGMGLVAACDIVVAAESAQFCLSEARLGLLPATISPYVLRAMGEQAARRYFITAERFDAVEAHRMGLVHVLSAPDGLDPAVERLLKTLLDNSPAAVRKSKQLVQDMAGAAIDQALMEDTANRIAEIRGSDEGREGVQAFLEKRPAAWLTAAAGTKD